MYLVVVFKFSCPGICARPTRSLLLADEPRKSPVGGVEPAGLFVTRLADHSQRLRLRRQPTVMPRTPSSDQMMRVEGSGMEYNPTSFPSPP